MRERLDALAVGIFAPGSSRLDFQEVRLCGIGAPGGKKTSVPLLLNDALA